MSASVLCPTCSQELPEQTTRKRKPYFVCDDCGVQVFVRLQRGMDRLRKATAGKFPLQDYVLCSRCDVAVRKIQSKVSRPLFGKNGIYCPGCERLLLELEPTGE